MQANLTPGVRKYTQKHTHISKYKAAKSKDIISTLGLELFPIFHHQKAKFFYGWKCQPAYWNYQIAPTTTPDQTTKGPE